MVFTITNNSSSSPPQQQPDDISIFLRQILHGSSSSSSLPQPFISAPSPSPLMRTHAQDQLPCFASLLQNIPASNRLAIDRISHNTTLNGVVFPLPAASNLSSESLSSSAQLQSFDNNDYAEDNECESEEGNDVAVGEEEETKQQQLRNNQSKRSRAAEVHNLSEKRRRSKINEKMKALQNLIPNSNKTDKASMLDEAIEYLKQLQLQVQMLSMRSGLNLHPMSLPEGQEILHPSQIFQMGSDDYDNGCGGSYDLNMTNALNTIPETSNTMLNLPNQCTSSVRRVPSPTGINSEAMSFGLESCVPANFHPLQLCNSAQTLCKESSMPRDNIATNSLVTTSTRLGHNAVDEWMHQKHGSTLLESNSGQKQNQLISSNFSGQLGATNGAQMTR